MDHRIKLYIEKTGILLAVYLLLKYLLPLVFPFFLAWLTVSLLASASRHFHRKLLPFTASVVAMFFFFTAATLKLTGWLLLEPCKDLIPELQTQLQTWINEYADLADWIPSSLSLHLSTAVPPVLSCAFGIFLYFMAVILFAHDWPDFQRLLTHLPFARPLEHAGKRIAQSLKGWAHAPDSYYVCHCPGMYCRILALTHPRCRTVGGAYRYGGCTSCLRHRHHFRPLADPCLLSERLHLFCMASPSLRNHMADAGIAGTQTLRRWFGTFTRLFSDLRDRRVKIVRCCRSVHRSLWHPLCQRTVDGTGNVGFTSNSIRFPVRG